VVGLAEEGMTMRFITHKMGLARQVAIRVSFMDVEQNSPASIPASEQCQLSIAHKKH
jgi:ABC-type polar amino acid transport system ATPase subunit